ncbi:M15 family metallopeptidase [Microbacterium sp. P02]|uniref:M15 family metallopeptidase n=1 Tax=unclassified Microbacterium TaxID=2609290 RepID=UPI00366EDA7E
MSSRSLPTSVIQPSRRRLPFLLVVVGAVISAGLAGVALLLVQGAFAAVAAPFSPSATDGLIAEGMVVTIDDDDVPAVARLNRSLRDALRQAERDAAADGISLYVTSGWRSTGYQRWLFEDAVELYASEEVARQYVATPERSSHVTGDAVDVGPIDAQFWLMEHGPAYGICQTYANERWHYELATAPGGTCPEMKLDAAS